MSALLSAAAVLPDRISAPTVEYRQLGAVLIVLGMAVVSVLVEAFFPRNARRPTQIFLVFIALIAALWWTVRLAGTSQLAAEGAVAVDGPGLVFQGLILLTSIVAAFLLAERAVDPAGDAFTARANALPGSEDERQFTRKGWSQTEIWPLYLFCVGGMLLFVIANDLLMLFVALEVMSLPLYLFAGLARRRRLLSQEAAMKYFLLGAFSSAILLYGAAMLYGFSGTVEYAGIASALSAIAAPNGLVIAGMVLVTIGLLFKVAAVPFHQWAPDVYQGSPTPVTAFMAVVVKIAAFGALLRFMYVALGGLRWDWRPMLWVIAILTMLIGAIFALTQTDMKRMLAYSSITHAGFLLIAVLATDQSGLSGIMIYLLAYAAATLGGFALLTLVRDSNGEATHLSSWAGLGKRAPWVAAAYALFLLSFAGIPLTAGFIGKFAVFSAGIEGGAVPVVVVAAVASTIAAFFYLRVIVLMFFTDPAPDGPEVVVPSAFTGSVIGVGVVLTLVVGILPQPFIQIAEQASLFVR